MFLRHAVRALLAGLLGAAAHLSASDSPYVPADGPAAESGPDAGYSAKDPDSVGAESGAGWSRQPPQAPAMGDPTLSEPDGDADGVPEADMDPQDPRATGEDEGEAYDESGDGEPVLELPDRVIRQRAKKRVLPPRGDGLRFSAMEAARTISALGDPSRFIQTLPGVGRPNDWETTLIVRGGSPDQTIFVVDGVPLARVNHFEGLRNEHGGAGLINLEYADEIVFHRGPFPARLPDRMAGAVELAFRDGDQHRLFGGVTTDVTGVGGNLEGPFPAGARNGSYAAAFRYSLLDLLVRSGVVEADGSPRYWNGQARVFIPAKGSAVRINAVGGKEDWRNLIPGYATLDLSGHTLAVSADWETRSGGRWTRVTANFQDLEQSLEFHALVDPGVPGVERMARLESGWEQRYGAGVEHARPLGPLALRMGVTQALATRSVGLEYRGEAIFVPETGEVKIGSGSVSSFLPPYLEAAFYGEATLPAGRWELYAGYRHLYEQLSDHHGPGPRLGARFRVLDGLSLKAAAGLHTQPHEFADFVRLEENQEPRLPQTLQASAGWEWLLPGGLLLDVEAFAKEGQYLSRPRLAPQEASLHQVYADTGRTTGRGFEAFLQRPFRGRHSYSFSYGFLHHREKDAAGFWAPSLYSVPHRFNASGEIALTRRIFLSGRYTLASGTPYIPYDSAASARAGTGIYDLSRAYRESGSAFSRLDVRLESNIRMGMSMVTIYGEVENVFDRTNSFERRWNPLDSKSSIMEGMGRLPTAGLTIRF